MTPENYKTEIIDAICASEDDMDRVMICMRFMDRYHKDMAALDVIKSLSIETPASYSGPISNGIAMENHPGMKE